MPSLTFLRQVRRAPWHRRSPIVPLGMACAWLSLSTPFAASTAIEGVPAAVTGATPVSLAAADLDEDGTADLLVGSAAGSRGTLAIRRGNPDFLYPNTPAARARRRSGQFVATPFLSSIRHVNLPIVPDFLHAGDFDADGHLDVIAAASGGQAWVLRGSGRGTLASPQRISLPGRVTAMTVGDMDRRDGRPDVVFGVSSDAGARLIVFAGRKGAWRASPEAVPLPAAAASLAIADLDTDRSADIAVRIGAQLLVVSGRASSTTSARVATALARPAAGDTTNRLTTALAALDGATPPLRMRLDLDGRPDLVAIRPGEATPALTTTLAATTRVVVNTNDSGPGSLRQAILDSNAAAGDDLIAFDIPGPGPHVIVPATPLPAVVPDVPELDGAVIIDGTTEPDFDGRPIVELSGALVGASGIGLTFGTSGCVVRGLVINRFGVGIQYGEIEGTPGVIGGIVEGNYIGTDATATTALGNGTGVALATNPLVGSASEITVGGTAAAARNVISGNGTGIAISGGVNHRVYGNLIGTRIDGASALGNTGRGIALQGAALVQIGGSVPGARNVIAANGDDGIFVSEGGGHLIADNHIGVDISGTVALGNGGDGIDVPDGGATITANVIAANSGNGVVASTSFAAIDVLDNRIGTNQAGDAALGNGLSGIDAIGFNQVITDNLVSGNGAHGIVVRGLDNLVQANRIGTDASGAEPLGNQGDGIRVLDQSNVIGGDDEGNVIAFNGGRGVVIPLSFSTTIPILSNAIFANGGIGIDLGDDGVTANDACDPDEGANDLLNFPVLTGVSSSATSTTIVGALNGPPERTLLLQFFASDAPDPSGFGEGARLLGSTTVTTDSGCNASFTATFPVALSPNHVVTATATSTNEHGQMATSELSHALPFVPQTAEAAIGALIAQVRRLVDQGELNGLAGFVLTVKLEAALFFVERDLPRVAAVQVRGFIQIVELLIRQQQLEPGHGRALIAAAEALVTTLASS